MAEQNLLSLLLETQESAILEAWITEQKETSTLRSELLPEADMRQQSAEFLAELKQAVKTDFEPLDLKQSRWDKLRTTIEKITKARLRFGLTHVETSFFVLTIKHPLLRFAAMDKNITLGNFLELTSKLDILLNNLAISIVDIYIRNREEIIKRQQEEMLELSTPVVKLWDKVLTLPLIGTLDSARTQVVMESLLQAIVDTQSTVAIIDITGVPTVDTLVAQHLMKTVAAARLMGADCIISGIRPQIAQSMVHLGVSFNDIITKATLADAIRYAFRLIGIRLIQEEVKG